MASSPSTDITQVEVELRESRKYFRYLRMSIKCLSTQCLSQQVKRIDVSEHQSVKLHTTIRFVLPLGHCSFSLTQSDDIAAAQNYSHRTINIHHTPTVQNQRCREVFPNIYSLQNNFIPDFANNLQNNKNHTFVTYVLPQ